MTRRTPSLQVIILSGAHKLCACRPCHLLWQAHRLPCGRLRPPSVPHGPHRTRACRYSPRRRKLPGPNEVPPGIRSGAWTQRHFAAPSRRRPLTACYSRLLRGGATTSRMTVMGLGSEFTDEWKALPQVFPGSLAELMTIRRIGLR